MGGDGGASGDAGGTDGGIRIAEAADHGGEELGEMRGESVAVFLGQQ